MDEDIKGRLSTGDYVYVGGQDNPYSTGGGYVLEHRAVVEKSIGRKLRKDEVVHHKDGCKTNNDIENLEVLSRSEHSRLHQLDRGHEMVRLKCPQCGILFVRGGNCSIFTLSRRKEYSWNAC